MAQFLALVIASCTLKAMLTHLYATGLMVALIQLQITATHIIAHMPDLLSTQILSTAAPSVQVQPIPRTLYLLLRRILLPNIILLSLLLLLLLFFMH